MESEKKACRNPGNPGRYIFLISVLFVIAVATVVLRGEYVSDALISIVVPELEKASGQKVKAGRIFVNLLPLFIEAEDMRIADPNGKELLVTPKVKGHIDITGLLSRQLTIRRLTIKDPIITAERNQINVIVSNVEAYVKRQDEDAPFKLKVKVIEVAKGKVSLEDRELDARADMKRFDGEFIFGRHERLRASLKDAVFRKEGWHDIACDIDASAVLRDNRVEVKQFDISSAGSRLHGKGLYGEGRGYFDGEVSFLVSTVKRFFGLRYSGEGKISVRGEVKIDHAGDQEPHIGNIYLDLKAGGDFYLETLFELLDVEKNTGDGLVNFDGVIRGPLNDISGSGKARLTKGSLYGVDIDSVNCNVVYKDGEMRFEDGKGSVYGGRAEAYAIIHLPYVDFFEVKVNFAGADSKPVLELVGWDPGLPAGKVDGDLFTSGPTFNPAGRFSYRSSSPGWRWRQTAGREGNVLDRIQTVRGGYSMKDEILLLSDLHVATEASEAVLNGSVDLTSESLELRSNLAGSVKDLTMPYYGGIDGSLEFAGDVTGSFENPEISGHLVAKQVSIEGYPANLLRAEMAYRKDLLAIRHARIISGGEEHRMHGKILFPRAERLFDVSAPLYELRGSVRQADFKQFVRIFYKEFPGEGKMNADFAITSPEGEMRVSGKALLQKLVMYRIPVDSVSTSFSYHKERLALQEVTAQKGTSQFAAEGFLGTGGAFSYSASSQVFRLKDFGLERMPSDAIISFTSQGHGTFDNPSLNLNAKLLGGTLKGRNMGAGVVDASLEKGNISVSASLFNQRMKLKGRGRYDETLPWSAELVIEAGRYDFLASSLLKDVPEDLQLNLEGRASLSGDRKNVTGTVNVAHLALSLFGQSFSNDSGIQVSFRNKRIMFDKFSMRGGGAAFKVKGSVEVGQEYDIEMNGKSALAPLKGLSKKIGYLKGDADFAFSVEGKWDRPEMKGGMTLTDASFGVKDFPFYVTSVNGYLYVDGQKLVLEGLSGKVGGGDVKISGAMDLKGFNVKKFYVETKLDDISATISKDFRLNFGGNLLCRGTSDAIRISGDLVINRARYREPVEWRTWLLTAKAVEKPKGEGSVFEKAELNVRVSGTENISIDNNMARAPVKIRGDMIVKGTVASPILFGRFEATEGYVYFRNNEFKIIYASVDFSDPHRIRPSINLTAETLVKGYDIRLSLEGQMERFTLALTSDPHLEEVDILALLTVGQLGKQLKGLEGGIGAGEATSFLTGKVQDVIEERLRSITGLDRFQVEPYVSSASGTVSPRVTVSKRLIGDRLFVTYANSLGTTEEQVVKVEYFLDKKMSLIGMRDERGSMGGDVKFRFEFK